MKTDTKVTKPADQAPAMPPEIAEVIAILKNQSISADYKVVLIEQVLLPAGK